MQEKNDFFKKAVYDKLVAKRNSIDTSEFVSKTKYDTDNQIQKIKLMMQKINLIQ